MPLAMCHTAAMMLRGSVGPDTSHLEPYEAGWASRAIAFVCVHEPAPDGLHLQVILESSPDGLRWAPLHAMEVIDQPGAHRTEIQGFGNWLRARLTAAEPCCADFYWVLK